MFIGSAFVHTVVHGKNMKKFNLDFFSCFNHVKHFDIPLLSMTRGIAAQKQSITKIIISVHSILLHILEMYSMWQFEILYFQESFKHFCKTL